MVTDEWEEGVLDTVGRLHILKLPAGEGGDCQRTLTILTVTGPNIVAGMVGEGGGGGVQMVLQPRCPNDHFSGGPCR